MRLRQNNKGDVRPVRITVRADSSRARAPSTPIRRLYVARQRLHVLQDEYRVCYYYTCYNDLLPKEGSGAATDRLFAVSQMALSQLMTH